VRHRRVFSIPYAAVLRDMSDTGLLAREGEFIHRKRLPMQEKFRRHSSLRRDAAVTRVKEQPGFPTSTRDARATQSYEGAKRQAVRAKGSGQMPEVGGRREGVSGKG
jgi:hypothetical protein